MVVPVQLSHPITEFDLSAYENFEDLAAMAIEQDPRGAIGYLTGSSFSLDTSRVFCWFQDLAGLTTQLREIEPRVYDIEASGALNIYQAKLDPVLATIRSDGLTEEARVELNNVVKDEFVIDWWGTFDDLATGDSEFAKNARIDFRGQDVDEDDPLKDEELDPFVEFLTTYRV